jgi:hypothetical protein
MLSNGSRAAEVQEPLLGPYLEVYPKRPRHFHRRVVLNAVLYMLAAGRVLPQPVTQALRTAAELSTDLKGTRAGGFSCLIGAAPNVQIRTPTAVLITWIPLSGGSSLRQRAPVK